ncbi:Hypothetical predicted protein [Mytilus galloprovincialis]|uniref:Ig-like domain-containing protein n=2 Tax=Mytilus galloprovincialis TaxID=29158 RepID=A0A8B6CFN5_MYTGA|nr:Hypothetical predicted protein [Mytilus galloprovincialis]
MTLAGSSNKIYWTIEDLPVIYGRNVTLFCNTSAVGSQKTTWMKESDVILHQGLSFQQDKYSGKEENDGSSLIIINATLSDFNTSYTCLSDVCSYESVLKINSTNFICLPQSTNYSFTITSSDIMVLLNLDRFIPVPKCQTLFNGNILITNQQESIHMKNSFYHGTINITSQSVDFLCGGNVTVMCLFGSLYYEAIETITLQNCDHGSNFPEHSFGLGRTISVCMLCFILCGLCFILVKYHCKLQPQTKKTKEESNLLNNVKPYGNGTQTELKHVGVTVKVRH